MGYWPKISTKLGDLLNSYDQLLRSALGLGRGPCTKSKYKMWHKGHASSVGGSIVADLFVVMAMV